MHGGGIYTRYCDRRQAPMRVDSSARKYRDHDTVQYVTLSVVQPPHSPLSVFYLIISQFFIIPSLLAHISCYIGSLSLFETNSSSLVCQIVLDFSKYSPKCRSHTIREAAAEVMAKGPGGRAATNWTPSRNRKLVRLYTLTQLTKKGIRKVLKAKDFDPW